MAKILMILWLLLSGCTPTVADTYYIDFEKGRDGQIGTSKESAWQLCPGMVGFKGSYRHHAGDRFVFKGGCVWPATALPFTIKFGGAENNPDIYTTDHGWYNGSKWVQPTFSGQHSRTQLLYANKKSFFQIKDLKFIDFGKAGISNGGKAIDINACANYAVVHCTIAPQAWIGLYLHSFSGAMEEAIRIDSNDISAAGQAIVVAVEAPNTRMGRISITNNAIHDLSSQIVGETHGDGIHTWNSVQDDHSQFLSDLTIRDNRFYGDFSRGDSGTASMTSLIYLTDPGKRAVISGNLLTYSKTSRFASLIWVRYFDSVVVANNTLVMDTAQGNIGIIVGQGDAGKNVSVKNNIIFGAKYCYYIYVDAILTTQIDHNNCTTTGPTIAYWNLVGKSWREWRQLGNDLNGSNVAPEEYKSSKSRRDLGEYGFIDNKSRIP